MKSFYRQALHVAQDNYPKCNIEYLGVHEQQHVFRIDNTITVYVDEEGKVTEDEHNTTTNN